MAETQHVARATGMTAHATLVADLMTVSARLKKVTLPHIRAELWAQSDRLLDALREFNAALDSLDPRSRP